MKIVFPEISSNQIVSTAIKEFPDIDWLTADSLDAAAALVQDESADSFISGIDFPTRDVILAAKAHIPLTSKYFSSCFVCERPDCRFVLADGGVNKRPNEDQLYCIVEDSAKTYEAYYHEQPKIAMLSYSTYGSGGKTLTSKKSITLSTASKKLTRTGSSMGKCNLTLPPAPKLPLRKQVAAP